VVNNQLKRAVRDGNPDAFKQLFRFTYPRLKGYCRLFIHDSDVVQDIIQECFLALWEKRAEINPEKSLESFLFVIVRNRCLNYLKEAKLKEGKIDPDTINIIELQYLYQLDFNDKEEKSLEEQLIISLQDAVDSLPAKMKEVFVKCKIEGKKNQEVADELGVTIKAVEKHISSAKAKISQQLLKKYPLLTFLIYMWIE